MIPPNKIHRLDEGIYVALTDKGCELLTNDPIVKMLAVRLSLDHGAIGKLVNLVRPGLGRKVHLRSDELYQERQIPTCKIGSRSNNAKLLSTGWLMTRVQEDVTCGNCLHIGRKNP